MGTPALIFVSITPALSSLLILRQKTTINSYGNLHLQVSCILYLRYVYGVSYDASAMAANGLFRYAMDGSFLFIPASTLFSCALLRPNLTCIPNAQGIASSGPIGRLVASFSFDGVYSSPLAVYWFGPRIQKHAVS